MELADFFFAGSVFDRTTPILRIRRRGGGGSAAKLKIHFFVTFYALARGQKRLEIV